MGIIAARILSRISPADARLIGAPAEHLHDFLLVVAKALIEVGETQPDRHHGVTGNHAGNGDYLHGNKGNGAARSSTVSVSAVPLVIATSAMIKP